MAEQERRWSLWTPDQHLEEAKRLVEGAGEGPASEGSLALAAMHVEMAKIAQLGRSVEVLRVAILQAGNAAGSTGGRRF